jgi:hypothetical protein
VHTAQIDAEFLVEEHPDIIITGEIERLPCALAYSRTSQRSGK